MGEGKRNKKRSLYGFKSIALFPDSGKGTKFYQSCQTAAYYPAYTFQAAGCFGGRTGSDSFCGHGITLTNEGILLKRRALEMVDLEDKIASEFKGSDGIVEGTITVGCGEFMAVEIFARICKIYKEKYPMVRFAVHTGTADTVFEMMNRGLVDIGLFLEPVNTEGLDYIRIQGSDHWIVGIKPDDPLAEKEYITKEDLIDLPLILPERLTVQSELANWFGKDFNRLNIAFTSNLGTNAGVMALYGLGYPVSVEGAGRYWRSDLLVQKKLYPEIKTSTVIAWRRNIPYSTAVSKLIEEINGFKIHM